MKSIITLLAISLLLSAQSTAQQNEIQRNTWRLSNVYLSTGINSFKGRAADISELRLLAPSSSILQSDLSDYSGIAIYYSLPYADFGAAAGFRMRQAGDKKHIKGPEFRVGINMGTAGLLYSSFYKEERVPVDTLYSGRTGEAFPVDSVSYRSVSIDLLRKYLSADFSVIFRSKNLLGFSLFAGLGIRSGYSYENQLRVRSNSSSRLESIAPFNGQEVFAFHPSEYKVDEESFPVANSFSFALYIPAGVNVRLSSRSAVLSRVNLFYEMQHGYYYYSVPAVRGISGLRTRHLIGMRIAID